MNTPRAPRVADDRARGAAAHLYDAECALHIAHQAMSTAGSLPPTRNCTRQSPNTEQPARIANHRVAAMRRSPAGRGHAINRRHLILADVCEELGISRSTFYDWRRAGKAPRCIKLLNGDIRVRRDDLEQWLTIGEGISAGPDLVCHQGAVDAPVRSGSTQPGVLPGRIARRQTSTIRASITLGWPMWARL